MQNDGLKLAIERAGSKARLGQALGITGQAISQWKMIPAEWLIKIESVTGVPRRKLRPDLYGPREML